MSTQTVVPSRLAETGKDDAIPFGRLLGVEFRKSWDTRAGFWLIAIIGLLVVAAEVIALIVFITQDAQDASWIFFSQLAGIITSLLLPVFGIMLVTAEWGQRTAMVTFSLEPRRIRVVMAKLLVGILLTVATVILCLIVGAVCNLIFGATGGDVVWNEDGLVEGFIGFFLIQALTMCVGFALAALLLNTAAAIVVFFAYAYVLPGLIALAASTIGWFEDFAPWIDLLEAQQPLYEFMSMSGTEWGHFVVSTLIWIVIPLGLGLRRILRAEVK